MTRVNAVSAGSVAAAPHDLAADKDSTARTFRRGREVDVHLGEASALMQENRMQSRRCGLRLLVRTTLLRRAAAELRPDATISRT